jgi:LmbE family N-acetylglucosaminyl deacetylase
VPNPVGEVGASAPIGRRWLVVSPHLDDGVLSLGASIARHVDGGGEVTVLTVLAGRIDGGGPAGEWDRTSGFQREAEAATARRDEDRLACGSLGALVAHVDGCDDQYEAVHDPGLMLAAVEALAPGHDEVFLPGYPLVQGDHRWVTETVGPALARLGIAYRLYAEEPYVTVARAQAKVATAANPDVSGWAVLRPSLREQMRKLRAVLAYRSQLAQLAHPARIPFPGGTAARALGQVWAASRRGEWVSALVVPSSRAT